MVFVFVQEGVCNTILQIYLSEKLASYKEGFSNAYTYNRLRLPTRWLMNISVYLENRSNKNIYIFRLNIGDIGVYSKVHHHHTIP